MQGIEIYEVLKKIGVTHLHHANSVITSCTFLEQGGLLSRKFVEDHSLSQTPQPSSDEIDRKFGIWDRIFVDHVDIHDRGAEKGAQITMAPFCSYSILICFVICPQEAMSL